MPSSGSTDSSANAFKFVLLIGLVNLFADFTYEGARSITGPFLGGLGASAAAIATIAGFGEFLGYSLRFVAGYISDRSGNYWLVTFIGFTINVLAVPALALASSWEIAAGLIVAERVGRAIRKPTVEAMLSYTTQGLGKGWVYAVNTALDQTGAALGPLLMAVVLFFKGDFRTGFALLLITALASLSILVIARYLFSHPTALEAGPTARPDAFTVAYWLYMAAGACVAAGFADFALIAYHFAQSNSITQQWIPAFYALAMGAAAVVSLLYGKLFDRLGLPVVLLAFALSALFAPFVFWGTFPFALIGMVLWGTGIGAQDTLLKALIVGVMPEGKRNLAFGLFYVGHGTGWFAGSVGMGFLYDYSIPLLVAFCVVFQLASLPLFLMGYTKR